MAPHTSEIAELAGYQKLLKGKSPELELELEKLLNSDDEIVILLYSRRCLETMVNEICAAKNIKISKTFPLKGIIDKLNKEEIVPSHIISSMLNLNSISTYGAHPKEFNPKQVRTVIINLSTILEWYLQFRETEEPVKAVPDKPVPAPGVTERKKEKKIPRRFRRIIWLGLIAGNILLGYIIISAANSVDYEEQDWILITDFENLTGDDVFNASLNAALEVTIQQSGFVNVFPDGKTTEILERMGKERTETVNEEIGIEIALREGIKLMLVCDISLIGNVYSINARVVETSSHKTLKTTKISASGKDEVLTSLDKLARKVRRTFGESIRSLNYQMVPLPQATTSSLDALQFMAEGWKAWVDEGQMDEAEELFLQAIDLDPEFAMAHADLGSLYYWTGNREKGEEYFTNALNLLDRLGEKEKLRIPANIERYRHNYDEAILKYNIYLRKYPNDPFVLFALGYSYMRLKHFKEAIDAFDQSMKFFTIKDPNAMTNMGACYASLQQYDQSIEYYLKGFEINPKLLTIPNLNREFGFAYVAMGEMERAREVFGKMMTGSDEKKARGYRSLSLLHMYNGKYSEAIKSLNESTKIHKMNGSRLSELRDRLFLSSAYKAKGMDPELKQELAKANDLAHSTGGLDPWWIFLLGKLYIRTGEIQKADALLTHMSGMIYEESEFDNADYNILKGEIELARGNAAESLELLESGVRMRHDAVTLESLANGYYATGNLDSAASKYLEITSLGSSSLGWEAQEYWIRSNCTLANIYEEMGDSDGAKQYYQVLMDLWKDADEDLPILVDAKSSLKNLTEPM